MTSTSAARLVALLAALPLVALAQSDTRFTYQGELMVDGAPALGEFDLEACVFADPTGGSALACSAPIEDLPVEDGRFTVVLDVGPVFDGSERFLELRVRGGAEIAPHLPLQPRQALRPAPQAQYAARVPFSGVVGVPPQLADGDDVGVTQLVAGAGLSGGTITSSGTIAIAPGAVTGAMLAPNSVGSAQVDPSQVQVRISGQCSEGEYFRGFAADGTPQCALLPVPFDRLVDESLDAGRHVELVLREDGRPLLAYHEDGLGSLRLYDCADAVCSSGTRRNLVGTGDAGEGIAMVLRSDGRPLIAFIDDTADALRMYSCNDAACTAGVTTTLDAPVVPSMVDLALRADGRAVVVYRSFGSFNYMRTWHCSNLDCTAGASAEHPAIPTGVAIVIRADGRPLLAAGGNAGAADSPRFWDCANAACSSGTLRTTSGVIYQGVGAMQLRADGRALLLTSPLGGTPGIVACGDVNCTSSTATLLPGCASSSAVDLALRPGGSATAACVRQAEGEYALGLHSCSTTSCSAGSNQPLLPFGRAGRAVAIAVRADDRPVIAYYDDVNGDLRLYVCGSAACP